MLASNLDFGIAETSLNGGIGKDGSGCRWVADHVKDEGDILGGLRDRADVPLSIGDLQSSIIKIILEDLRSIVKFWLVSRRRELNINVSRFVNNGMTDVIGAIVSFLNDRGLGLGRAVEFLVCVNNVIAKVENHFELVNAGFAIDKVNNVVTIFASEIVQIVDGLISLKDTERFVDSSHTLSVLDIHDILIIEEEGCFRIGQTVSRHGSQDDESE